MRLTIKNISAFLMEKGLLKPKSVVDGDFLVTQTQNRNAIFKIHIKNDKSLFVKQLVNFDPQNTYFLQKDATCLWLIKNEKAFEELSKYVPRYYGYDPEKQVLIVEYLPEAKNMEEIFTVNKKLSPELLDQAAKILASYHFKLEDQTLTKRPVQFFMRQLPWIFQMATSTGNFAGNQTAQYGNNPVISYLTNNEEYLSLMKAKVAEYEFTSLIHGDIKNVNFILQDQEDVETLRLIDWEIADIGDPLWDAAGMIQSLFTSRVMMNMSAPNMPYQASPGISEQDMLQCMAEIRTFWQSYSKYRRFGGPASQTALKKALGFAGMRMVQTAFEFNNTAQQLLPNTIQILQISHSLLQNTDVILAQIHSSQTSPYEPVR